MDATTMSQVGFGGGLTSILALIFAILRYMNHRNVRSHCCGRTAEFGVDLDTPPPEPSVVKVAPAPPSSGS